MSSIVQSSELIIKLHSILLSFATREQTNDLWMQVPNLLRLPSDLINSLRYLVTLLRAFAYERCEKQVRNSKIKNGTRNITIFLAFAQCEIVRAHKKDLIWFIIEILYHWSYFNILQLDFIKLSCNIALAIAIFIWFLFDWIRNQILILFIESINQRQNIVISLQHVSCTNYTRTRTFKYNAKFSN